MWQKTIEGKLSKLQQERVNIRVEIDRLKTELEKVALDVFSNWHFKCSEHWHGMVLKPHTFFPVQLKGLISNRSRNIEKIEKKINEIMDKIYKY